ncbi:MAG: transcriptional repressor [Oscillospiraceae bacterium]|nr:transcriptional repressor [Oscillospiraceae bacterium]
MTPSTKNFRKRNAIYDCLCRSKAHPSAETIYTQLKPEIPDLSLGTVYRNLNLFRQQGLASCVATVGGVERFDGNVDPHVHFICTDCNAVIDLEEMSVPRSLTSAAESSVGGLVTECQLSFTGKCRSCVNTK